MAKKISYCPHILYNYLRTNQNSIQSKIGLSEKSFVLLDIMDEIEAEKDHIPSLMQMLPEDNEPEEEKQEIEEP